MTPHPATAKRNLRETELLQAISRYASARVLHNRKEADQPYLDRCREEMRQAIQFLKDACYEEVDDGHGLGHAGLDLTRELIEDAVWFPIHEAPGTVDARRTDAWLVSDEKIKAVAAAIGVSV